MRAYDGGISVVWSPVNQAWIVMWMDMLLRIIGDREEMHAYLRDLGIDP
jgi:hypothetical protein